MLDLARLELYNKSMYALLIRKMEQDKTLTKEEVIRRRLNIIEFCAKEDKKYFRLLKKIKKQDEVSFENFFSYLGYWYRFKLLCEGKELSIENALNFKDDIAELNLFIKDVLFIDQRTPVCD